MENMENIDITYVEKEAFSEFGSIVKEGDVLYQSKKGDWVKCHLIVRERAILYEPQQQPREEHTSTQPCQDSLQIIQFSDSSEVKIKLLPDSARASHESKLFPFAVGYDNGKEQEQSSLNGTTTTPYNSEDATKYQVIFATSQGREMWEWASTIKWLGTYPPEEHIPEFEHPMSTDYIQPYYINCDELQDMLLRMFTYKHCPPKALSYTDVYNNSYIGREEEYEWKKKKLLEYIDADEALNLPNSTFSTPAVPKEFDTGFRSRLSQLKERVSNATIQTDFDFIFAGVNFYQTKLALIECIPVGVENSNEHLEEEGSEYDSDDSSIPNSMLVRYFTYPENTWELQYYSWNYEDEEKMEKALEQYKQDEEAPEIMNYMSKFGNFVHSSIIGSCVHVNEKCFELLLSADMYDISTTPTNEGNSALSMLCEGNYNKFRRRMTTALWKKGFPKRLDEYKAGCTCYTTFSYFITKPSHINGIGSNPKGLPVHPDDKSLCRYLRDECGDGRKANEKLLHLFEEAWKNNKDKFSVRESDTYGYSGCMEVSAMVIPKNLMAWGRTTLKTLDLRGCSIIDLPEELYEFKSLTHLDVSGNCLLGLSHQLGNLTNLEYLRLDSNLIEELPDTIEKLDRLTDSQFSCSRNPISKPPSAVWARGITPIREYFRQIRDSGEELNTNLQVLVLGLSEAGKTSLINGIIDPDVDPLTRIGDRTIGIEKRIWTVDRSNENKDPANFLIYDFAGQEEYYATHHLFLGSKALYLLAFDLSKYTSNRLDRQILSWWDTIQNRVSDVNSNSSKTPKVIIVATKADLVDDAPSKVANIYQSLTNRFRLRNNDVEARITQLGNELLKLDPRKRVSKMNVANLDKKDRKELMEKIQDEYKELPDDVKVQIQSKEEDLSKLHQQKQCTTTLPEKILAVSSRTLENFHALKAQIFSSLSEEGPSGKYFTHFDAPIPYSWTRIRKYVYDKSTQIGCECMQLPYYLQTISTDLQVSKDIVTHSTQFLHDLGDVLYYPKHNLVFLRPSFLVDVFKLVIRHDHKEATYWREEMQSDLNIGEAEFQQWKNLLLEKGQIVPELLNVLWSPLVGNLSEGSSDLYDNWMSLLQTFDIAALIEQEGKIVLLIPEFQPKNIMTKIKKSVEADKHVAQRLITVDKSLPDGILKRIQVNVLKNIYGKNGATFYELAQEEFYIKDKSGTALYFKIDQDVEACQGVILSEGIRFFIQSKAKKDAQELLEKVEESVDNVLKEFTGIRFETFALYTYQEGDTSAFKMTVLNRKKENKQPSINVTVNKGPKKNGIELNVDDILLQFYESASASITCEASDLSATASYKSGRNLLNDGTKKMELCDLLQYIGIEIKERQKIINILTKKNIRDSNDFLEFMDDDLQAINGLFGQEVRFKEKMQIKKWLKTERGKKS